MHENENPDHDIRNHCDDSPVSASSLLRCCATFCRNLHFQEGCERLRNGILRFAASSESTAGTSTKCHDDTVGVQGYFTILRATPYFLKVLWLDDFASDICSILILVFRSFFLNISFDFSRYAHSLRGTFTWQNSHQSPFQVLWLPECLRRCSSW